MVQKTIIFLWVAVMLLSSCAHQFGETGISKPDEYTRTFEAKERVILKAVARLIEEKNNGDKVSIDFVNNRVDSDYVVSDDWRTKTSARVTRLNWKECKVTLAITTEKKTQTGWEMRRLLGKKQYDSFFSLLELKIYEEMANVE
ncbi:MAG: hypothetical protein KBA28_02945 [Syntrophaceae bacterium]|jgi:hypothetical protein|nr:hypothetical protein [Syntrophaceae bacterium]HOC58515.1 hypothetical protein [Smithellaceae bacterium]HQM44830.1 hypothetical protein [Smithellaceae bacterium]